MKKPLSRSKKLIADMHFEAMSAMALSPNGVLPHREVMQAIEKNVPLDEWALATYEGSGNTRWRSIFAFSSVGLVKANYVTKSRSIWTITESGRAAIHHFEPRQFLEDLDLLYLEWKNKQILSSTSSDKAEDDSEDGEDIAEAPQIRIAHTLKAANEALAAELIDTIKNRDPGFFETLVVDLVVAMGYGGSREKARKAVVGKSGDNGIDGIISEDKLGLENIYLQAKRYTAGSVGEGEIRDFKGALDAKGAKKGVFITTSYFTDAAKKAAEQSLNYKIVLIDGARLASLMIEYNLGVSVVETYQLKKIDIDFFSED